MPGLWIEDLFLGISQPRNEKLANIFYRLKYIEAYGTGLRLIMQHYEDFELKPEITATHGAFSLKLPNMNYVQPIQSIQRLKLQHKIIIDYLRDNPFITNEIVQGLLSVKQTRAYTVIREMLNGGMIVKNGTGRNDNEYVLKNRTE